MRKVNLCFFLLMVTVFCYAQNGPEKVQIVKWKAKVFAFSKGYWDRDWAKEVISKIGQEEFNKVKSFSKRPLIPKEMSLLTGAGITLKDTAFHYDKLNKLKMYLIATYTQDNDPENPFEMAILRVPYEENKEWDKNAKWDTVYFFIRKKYVKPVKE